MYDLACVSLDRSKVHCPCVLMGDNAKFSIIVSYIHPFLQITKSNWRMHFKLGDLPLFSVCTTRRVYKRLMSSVVYSFRKSVYKAG